eukprot:TRINITY_DN10677_c0_g1_i2.p1 TRINITY_DN10677_c0_g1~~TRINITY_DN10677_c0_g1_i2.p1  ORF type:complete len:678 (-),score=174.08 TRINITY_DN10677_c0_g1_i2:1235-3268(-)
MRCENFVLWLTLQILRDQISPTLQKLQQQQKQYISFLENKRDFERLEKFRIAFQYSESSKILKGSDDQLNEYTEKLESLEAECKEHQSNLKKVKEEITRLTEKKEKQISFELHELEEQVDQCSKEIVKRKAAFSHLVDSRKQEEGKMEELVKSLEKLERLMSKKQQQLNQQNKILEEYERSRQTKKEQFEGLKRQYQAVSVGVAAGGEGAGKTLADQLMEAKKEATHCDTESRSCSLRLKHAQKELENSRQQLKHSFTEYQKLQSQEKDLQTKITSLQKDLCDLDFSEDRFGELVEKRRQLLSNIRSIEHDISSKRMHLSRIDFNYDSPYPNFNRTKVHGRIAHLIDLKDSRYSSALDVAAGSKLYNVVVDTETTGKDILSKGNLKQRVTIIPLNKVHPKTLSKNQVEEAYKLVGKDKVASALSLVDFDSENRAAIEYVFGTTLVCHSSDDAKQVTFHKTIKTRSVTIEGDLFDPVGTLTGGSKPEGSNLLAAIHELRQLQKHLQALKEELSLVERELNELTIKKDKYQTIREACDLKSQEINLLAQRVERTPYFQLQERVKTMEVQMAQDETMLVEFNAKHVAATKLAQEIQERIQNFNQEDELMKTKENMKEIKVQLEKLNEDTKTIQQDQVRYNSEIEQLKEEHNDLNSEIQQIQAIIHKLDKDIEVKSQLFCR